MSTQVEDDWFLERGYTLGQIARMRAALAPGSLVVDHVRHAVQGMDVRVLGSIRNPDDFRVHLDVIPMGPLPNFPFGVIFIKG